MTMMTRRLMLASATALATTPVWAQSTETEAPVIEDIVIGNPDASVEIIEYASFTCPHCRSFHEGPFKQLKADYIDTGKIKFVYREVFFDPFGLWAAIVARCAGPDKYMGIADMIYAQQSEWPVRDNPGQTAENLKKIGLIAGLEGENVDACLGDREFATALVENYRANATADGVNSTPTFIINGRKYTNMPYDELAEIIEKAL